MQCRPLRRRAPPLPRLTAAAFGGPRRSGRGRGARSPRRHRGLSAARLPLLTAQTALPTQAAGWAAVGSSGYCRRASGGRSKRLATPSLRKARKGGLVWARAHVRLRIFGGVRAHGPVQGMCLSMSHALGAMGRPSIIDKIRLLGFTCYTTSTLRSSAMLGPSHPDTKVRCTDLLTAVRL